MLNLLLKTGVLAGLLIACSSTVHKEPTAQSISATSTFKPVALVELFTSQGCSSCPPADKLLTRTIAQAHEEGKNIIAISFHVDYWNRLGWTDPFSDKTFSQRQQAYVNQFHLSSAYTPQMIVNGTDEFVGSDQARLTEAINKSLKQKPEADFSSLTVSFNDDGSPQVKFSVTGNIAGSTIHFALLSMSETTSIKRGENQGVTSVSENIVRQFVSVPASATGEIGFKNTPLPDQKNLAIVGYIQQNNTLKITGAAMANL